MQGLVGSGRKKQRGCGDQAMSVRGEMGGSRPDGESIGDEIQLRKGERKKGHFRKKARWSFSKAVFCWGIEGKQLLGSMS